MRSRLNRQGRDVPFNAGATGDRINPIGRELGRPWRTVALGSRKQIAPGIVAGILDCFQAGTRGDVLAHELRMNRIQAVACGVPRVVLHQISLLWVRRVIRGQFSTSDREIQPLLSIAALLFMPLHILRQYPLGHRRRAPLHGGLEDARLDPQPGSLSKSMTPRCSRSTRSVP